MKTRFYLSALSLLALSFVFAGCDKDEDPPANTDEMYTINATLSGASEVPSNTSTATGTTTGSYNATKNTLTYTVTWNGLTGPATVGHFHGAALPGANAGAIIHYNLIPNSTNPNAGSATGTIQLNDTQETDLLAGKWYSNIHTATYTGGEIRGQVSAVK